MGGSNNIFRRNTMHKMGASSTLNVGNASIIELNDISDSGYLQSDGALVHCMINQQPNIQVRYNWLHDTIKYGVRFDGEGDGYGGYVHHNVIWNVQGGIMIKGYNHNIYNNTAFDNGNKTSLVCFFKKVIFFSIICFPSHTSTNFFTAIFLLNYFILTRFKFKEKKMKCHEVDYEIIGDDMQIVEI